MSAKTILLALLCFPLFIDAGTCCGKADQSCASVCTVTGRCDEGNVRCKDVLLPFSQSENTARRYAGVSYFQNLAHEEGRNFHWHADATVEYQQNYNTAHLGAYFFPNGSNTILVGEDRSITGSADVRATDLGLSETFSAFLTINPRIQNVIFEPAFYLCMDNWAPGLWMDFTVPIVYTRWHMNACQITNNPGGTAFVPPSINAPATTMFDTYTAVQNSMKNGGATPSLGLIPSDTVQQDVGLITPVGAKSVCDALGGSATWGDRTTPLSAAKILCNCAAGKTGVADIPVQLGYNFVQREDVFFGAFLRAVFPTGQIKNRNSIFDPTVGYGRWQLGAGVQGRVKMYEKSDDTRVDFYTSLYVTHLFAKRQCRVFDLCGRGCWSRYLLMKEADANGNYTGNLFSVADIFSACVKSQFDWNLDGLVVFDVAHKHWLWNFGYEIKARDRETFDCCNVTLCKTNCDDDDRDCNAFDIGTKQYGVKGPQIIGGIGSKVLDAADTTINQFGNQAVPFQTQAGVPIGSLVIPSSTLLNASNFAAQLDFESTRIPRAVLHKIWSHVGYTWDFRYPVALGAGFEVEFTAKNRSPEFWGFWAKVSVAYN